MRKPTLSLELRKVIIETTSGGQSVCLSVCNLISKNKPFVLNSRISVWQLFRVNFSSKHQLVTIGSVTVAIWLLNVLCFHITAIKPNSLTIQHKLHCSCINLSYMHSISVQHKSHCNCINLSYMHSILVKHKSHCSCINLSYMHHIYQSKKNHNVAV